MRKKKKKVTENEQIRSI